jgi:hypothetical protein
MPAHRRAEHMRQQLRTKADPEHRPPQPQRALDGTQLGQQVRAVLAVLHIHRAAQHHQPAVALHLGLRLRIALEIDEADPMPARPDQRIQRAERLGGDVLEDQQAGHAEGGEW